MDKNEISNIVEREFRNKTPDAAIGAIYQEIGSRVISELVPSGKTVQHEILSEMIEGEYWADFFLSRVGESPQFIQRDEFSYLLGLYERLRKAIRFLEQTRRQMEERAGDVSISEEELASLRTFVSQQEEKITRELFESNRVAVDAKQFQVLREAFLGVCNLILGNELFSELVNQVNTTKEIIAGYKGLLGSSGGVKHMA
ncbi:MAG: hypothetical protein LAO21_10755 [Acidobacteriia bacterium]|nr:hypothetical protein [Terriglobia bacterium]